MLTSVSAFMAAHYMNSGPLSDDREIRALMAKTLVLGANAREEWMAVPKDLRENPPELWKLAKRVAESIFKITTLGACGTARRAPVCSLY